MKILVTGGAGFIASHIVDKYIELGHEVAILDDLSTGVSQNINSKSHFIKVDIRSQEAAELLSDFKPEIVNHHAAQIDLRKSVENPAHDADINILGLLNLMQAIILIESVKKVIFASTGGAIYGDTETLPTPEDYPTSPASPYGIAKLASEYYLSYYQKIHNIPFVSLRYGNVYGPRQNPHGEAGVVAIFSKMLLKGLHPLINGNGLQTRDFVFVSDVVEANVKALEESTNGIYNIATGKETNINTIFESLAQEVSPELRAKHGPAKPGEQKRSSLDCSKAKQELGWEAKTDLQSGIKQTLSYFKTA